MVRGLFSSQLRINVVSGIIVAMINVAVLAMAYPVYLRFLGYERYGVWLILATVLSVAQVGNLGVGHAVTKLVAEEYGRNDLSAVQRYVTSAVGVLLLIGIVPLIVVVLFRTSIVAMFNLTGKNAEIALRLLPLVGCLSLYVLVVQALNATLSGLGRMDLASYAQGGGRIVMVCVATFLLSRGGGIESLLLGSVVSYAVIHISSAVLIRREANIRLLNWSNLDVSCVKRLLSFGGGVMGFSIVSMLLSPFNKMMLARYAGVSTVPVYEIAYNGGMQVRGLLEAGLRAMMPEVSRISGEVTETAKARIRQINRRAVMLVANLGLSFHVLLIAGCPFLLRLWLGTNMAVALPTAMRISLLASFTSLACVPAFYILLGLGQVRYCVIGQAVLACVTMAVVGVLIWKDGRLSVEGTLLATVIGTGAASLYFILQKRRLLRSLPLSTAGPLHTAAVGSAG